MIALALALALVQAPDVKTPSAGELISKMFAHYASADSMVGHIRLTVAASNDSVTVDTDFAFEKPSLVRIHQVLNSATPREWLTVSDGSVFSYNIPDNVPGPPNKRLTEVVNNHGAILSFRDIYGASTESLKDRSMPLDVAFSRATDLKYRMAQWVNHAVEGRDKVGDKDAYIVGGDWRDYATSPPAGHYRMWVTADGDLLKYEEKLKIAIKAPSVPGGTLQTELTNTWDVDIKVGAKPDHALFVLP